MAPIRRIKEKIRRIAVKTKAASKSRSKSAPKDNRKQKKAGVSSIAKRMLRKKSGVLEAAAVSSGAAQEAQAKDFLGAREVEIEKAKFSHFPLRRPRSLPQELPGEYGKDKLVLQVRDPWWLHSYWEVTLNTWNRLKDQLKDTFYKAKKILRVYDVSQINFNGKNAHRFFDIEVAHEANSWYIDAAGPGRSWCVDLGLKLPNGEFITILRSNVVQTPLDGPSWITDEEWMIPEEIFARLYGMGFGFGKSSPAGKALRERALSSAALSSPGIASMASPTRLKEKQRNFWMVLDCELIVYGATEPDAKVTVQGRPIKLRPDGTFTLRYALPDGKQVIPVKGVSADELEERTITPTVTRDTKYSRNLKEE